jgi:hypothetical protein
VVAANVVKEAQEYLAAGVPVGAHHGIKRGKFGEETTVGWNWENIGIARYHQFHDKKDLRLV